MFERLRFNLALAVRGLLRTPGTTLATLLTLAVAVGVNLAMYGLIDRAILSPPSHIDAADRVFTLTFEAPASRGVMTTTSDVAFRTVSEHVPALSNAAAWRRTSTNAVIDGDQIRVDALLVTDSYFPLLGAGPQRGRISGFDAAGAVPPAIVSHAFWRSAFASDAGVVGRRLTINRIEFEVTAVMPPGFSGHSAARADVWVPLAAAMRDVPDWTNDAYRNSLSIAGRVRSGEEAAAAAQASAALERRVLLAPIAGGEVGGTERRIAYALAGVSVLVLAIGLANAATLLLVRGTRRRRDVAIRAALGATRGRLFTQLLSESAVLATIATAGALTLAFWLDETIRRLLLSGVVESEGPSMRTLVAAVLAGSLAFALAAVVGLLQLPRQVRPGDLAGAISGRRRSRAGTALLLVQTTLSVVLIAGAGMFGRSLYNLAQQDFGMRLDGVLLAGFERGPGSVPNQGEILGAALERMRSLPGVDKATPIQSIPFGGRHVLPVGVPGRAESPSVDGQLPFLNAATPEFFDILGIQIVEGRRFTADDDRRAPVVIVNETMARGVWPGESALGKCIRIGFDPSFDPFSAAGPPGPPTSAPCREVVGVARDVRQRSVVPTGIEGRLMQYFVPYSQVPGPPGGLPPQSRIQGLLVRATTDAHGLVAPVRSAIVNGRSDLPFVDVRPYTDMLEAQMRPWRLGTFLLALFGALALGVAAIGLYAAFTHAVAERQHEMAIRIAIGERRGSVLAMVLREAGILALAGAACGCALTVSAGRWVRAMLFGTAPSDPLVLGPAAAVMLAVACIATLLPARAASRADPMVLLRTD
jgi:putative ABC transport system permease protein